MILAGRGPAAPRAIRGIKGEAVTPMGMAIVDRAELERALAHLKAARSTDANIQAAADTIAHLFNGAGAQQLLTPAEAADALGVESAAVVSYWLKTDYLHGVKRDGRTMVPVAEVERIMDEDRVRNLRAANKLEELTSELGWDMTDEEMQELSASRPGTLPWLACG